MDNIIVYIDDAAYALHLLQPMLPGSNAGDADHGKTVNSHSKPDAVCATSTHWILVGCAPRVTRRVSKWVTHSARDSWRRKWADKVFSAIVPTLQWRAGAVTTLLADASLSEQTEALVRQHGAARVLDARRPKTSQDGQPETAAPAPATHGIWSFAAAMVGGPALVPRSD